MLSCRTVLEALPGIEAGEQASGAVRDHLSNCEACRAEASRLRGDLEVLRKDLAALAPSPFLEDAVLEAVRSATPLAGARRGPGLKTAAAVAVAAAALLVGVLIADRSGPPASTLPSASKDGATDPGGPGRVEMPPSAGTVQAARIANAEPLSKPGGDRTGILVHRDRDREGRYRMHLGTSYAPPADGAPHRWVEEADDLEAQQNFYRMAGTPARSVMILGLGILERLVPRGERAQPEWLAAALSRLLPSKANPYVDVTVQAPYAGAPKVRVRVVVSESYSGSLLLEEPLARALGLHHFEKRGGCTIAGNHSLAGRRATARVRIASVDFDEILEVQVLRAASPTPKGPRDAGTPALALEFLGAQPDSAFVTIDVPFHAPMGGPGVLLHRRDVRFPAGGEQGPARLPLEKAGPIRAGVIYDAGKHPKCEVFLPPVDLGAEGPLTWRFDMRRVTLPGSFEPGAQVMVSRVWRGNTAIPSRESVASTMVAKDGSISFVHVPGEIGDLRLRVMTKDKLVHWVDVTLEEDPPPGVGRRISLQVDADGTVHFGGAWKIRKGDPGMRADVNAIKRLQQVIRDLAKEPHAPPSRTWEAEIEADSDTPWAVVQWLMQALAAPGIEIRHLRFSVRGMPGRAVRNVLPSDGGPELDEATGLTEKTDESAPGRGQARPGRKPFHKLKIIFTRRNSVVRYRTRGSIEPIEGTIDTGTEFERRLRDVTARAVSTARKAGASLTVELVAPPPSGGRVPYSILFRTLELLEQAGVRRVLFEGAAW